jgi:hypothetical protein
MDPRIASELLLRLPHLPLRVQEHARRAQGKAQSINHHVAPHDMSLRGHLQIPIIACDLSNQNKLVLFHLDKVSRL